MSEEIKDPVLGTLLAIVVKNSYRNDGTKFLTHESLPMQLGYISRKEGEEIKPHIHRDKKREIHYTAETLLVKSGLVEVSIFSINENKLVVKRELEPGDLVLLLLGGHGFKFIKDSEMIEVKQGHYIINEDKEII